MSEGQEFQQQEKDVRRRCELIVHASAVAAGGAAAAALVPGADAVAIMPVQVAMVAAVSREYGIAPSASLVKSTVYASLSATHFINSFKSKLALRNSLPR